MDCWFSCIEVIDLESFDSAQLMRDSETVLIKNVNVAFRVEDDWVILLDVKSFIFKIVSQIPGENSRVLQLFHNNSYLIWIISWNNRLDKGILLGLWNLEINKELILLVQTKFQIIKLNLLFVPHKEISTVDRKVILLPWAQKQNSHCLCLNVTSSKDIWKCFLLLVWCLFMRFRV